MQKVSMVIYTKIFECIVAPGHVSNRYCNIPKLLYNNNKFLWRTQPFFHHRLLKNI